MHITVHAIICYLCASFSPALTEKSSCLLSLDNRDVKGFVFWLWYLLLEGGEDGCVGSQEGYVGNEGRHRRESKIDSAGGVLNLKGATWGTGVGDLAGRNF